MRQKQTFDATPEAYVLLRPRIYFRPVAAA